MLAGTFTEPQQGEADVKLPVGTYFAQPAKIVHRNGCVKGGADCIVYVHFAKGADSVITDAHGTPVKK